MRSRFFRAVPLLLPFAEDGAGVEVGREEVVVEAGGSESVAGLAAEEVFLFFFFFSFGVC